MDSGGYLSLNIFSMGRTQSKLTSSRSISVLSSYEIILTMSNGEKRNAYRLLVGKKLLGIPRRRWVDTIKMGLGDI
jgi:hypothetical protein